MFKLSLAGLVFASIVQAGENCTGIWSRGADSLYDALSGKTRATVAPNGLTKVIPKDQGLVIEVDGKSRAIDGLIAAPPITEVLWSPHSTEFVITSSDGGLVGSWHVWLSTVDFDASKDGAWLERLVKNSATDFAECEPKEDLNVGALGWIDQGSKILIAAEVPPHSSCRNMGSIIGFVVDLQTKKVLYRLSERNLRTKYGPKMLGCRFVR